MKRLLLHFGLWMIAVSAVFAAEPLSISVLPVQFGGWQMQGKAQVGKEAAAADPVNAAVLKEYGFNDLESANYVRDDGRKLTVKTARFNDASGAYGAFTFYKSPEMLNEKFGDQGASLNNRILFYRGNVLVDAVFEKLSVMSAAEMRELASLLPLPAGGARNLPTLPTYLPRQAYVKNSAHYVLGPAALEKTDSPLPAAQVDFAAGAEVILGKYKTPGGEATLMLISYPTPQIAAAHMKAIDDAHSQSPNSGAATPALFDRRSGPIVAVASGSLAPSDAKSLLGSVNYDADVTWNENTFINPKNNLGSLLVNIILLCGILIGLALVAGVAFGGIRVLVKRMFPDRHFGGSEEAEFIALHLEESGKELGQSTPKFIN